MTRLSTWFLFLSMTLTVAQAQPIATNPAGTYQCSGNDPVEKSNYTNIPLLITKEGDIFHFNWDFGKNGGIILGIGALNKNVPSVIAAAFWNAKDTKNIGVITYQIQPDGNLDGNWTIPNRTQIGTENCRRINAS